MEKVIFETIFISILAWVIIPRLTSRDKSEIWNPLIFISIYLIYYVLVPVINQNVVLGYDWTKEASGYLLAASVSLICIVFGFKTSMKRECFYYSNSVLDGMNKTRIGIALCVLAFVAYGSIKGFTLNFIVQNQIEAKFNAEASYNNPTAYIEYLVSLFCVGCPTLMILAKKKKRGSLYFLVALLVALIIYAISGFRYRILILFAVLMTTYYLYPVPKKLNYVVVGTVAIVIFIGMAVIERTRSYGRGLDFTKIENQSVTSMEASEGDFVSSFSALVIDRYTSDDFIYFEPIITAISMPIPRALFPEKPNGYYIREANLKIYNTIGYGNAFIYFAEAYISFGWLGIIFQGLFIGWVCRIFWDNYRRNPHSLGSVILLGIFNGFCFVWVSRGYFAQVFTTYMYFLIIPFWVVRLLGRMNYFQQTDICK